MRSFRATAALTGFVMIAVAAHAAPHPSAKPKPALSIFQRETAMSPAERIRRWAPLVKKASHRFDVPIPWINAVMRVESGGRTMLSETLRMISAKGAMGVMQVMPQTFAEMRAQYRLGADAFEPADNIAAGSAYLRWLKGKYGYPALFAAYNAGPQRVDALLAHGTTLPQETRDYISRIGEILDAKIGGADGTLIRAVTLTQPDGATVQIDPIVVTSIREAEPGEYAPGVVSVIRMGRLVQGVKEDVATATAAIRLHGGKV